MSAILSSSLSVKCPLGALDVASCDPKRSTGYKACLNCPENAQKVIESTFEPKLVNSAPPVLKAVRKVSEQLAGPVEKGIPIPKRILARESKWNVLFDELKEVGDSRAFNSTLKNTSSAMADWHKKNSGKRCTIRRISETQFRVWRVK